LGKEIDGRQGHQIGQVQLKQRDSCGVQQRNQCRSNLGFQHVGRGDDDVLNLEFLLQDFEEWFNLPALLVDSGNRIPIGAQPVVVCDKHQDSADILAQPLDAVQQMRTCLQGYHADELDGLILEVWRVWCGSHCSSMSHWAWFLTRATKNPWKLVHLEDRNEVLSLQSSTTDDAKNR
jgi:hypothetical protein